MGSYAMAGEENALAAEAAGAAEAADGSSAAGDALAADGDAADDTLAADGTDGAMAVDALAADGADGAMDALTAGNPTTTTLRELLPEASRARWIRGGLADRPLELGDVMQRAQLMAAAMAANKLLNEVLVDMGMEKQSRLLDAVQKGYEVGVLSRAERDDLKKLNRLANQARFDF